MTSFSGQSSLLGSWGQRGIRKDKRKWRGEPQKGDGISALEKDREAEEAQVVIRKHTGCRSVYTDSSTCVGVGRDQDDSGRGHRLMTLAHTAQRKSLCSLPEAPPLSQEAGSGKGGKTQVRTCHSVGRARSSPACAWWAPAPLLQGSVPDHPKELRASPSAPSG